MIKRSRAEPGRIVSCEDLSADLGLPRQDTFRTRRPARCGAMRCEVEVRCGGAMLTFFDAVDGNVAPEGDQGLDRDPHQQAVHTEGNALDHLITANTSKAREQEHGNKLTHGNE